MSPPMPILNYTTKIDSEKTFVEIQKILARIGARKILADYTSGVLESISFMLEHRAIPVYFKLPARIPAIERILIDDPNVPRKLKTAEQASRVAWRICKDWIEAQVALVEAEQADVVEVFLPYAQHPDTGETVYERLERTDFLMLTDQR